MWSAIFFAKLMAILGGLALVLAGVGVFGVVSYATAKRTREFGIRAALGAEPRQIALLVLRKTASLAGYGVALGLVLALLLERVTRAMLFETDGRDPATLLSISLLLIAISAAAAAAPTLRATRVNPMQSLREE
jgi:putative ABC transport system permease protein